MFDEIGKNIDAVFIATPNHQHALPAMLAMQLGKNVYCEKPLCHTIAEARELRAMAAKSKVATQMGNQGHCEDGYRKLCEYIWAGVIGEVKETHSWTNRANGGLGPRPPAKPVPAGLHWDEWIGPARIGIITMTCTRTNGMVGSISEMAPSATWVAMSSTAFTGRSRWTIPRALKSSRCAAGVISAIPWAVACAGTFPPAANCRR